MAEDVFKPGKVDKLTTIDAGGKAAVMSVPVFGVVKDNIDPTRSGRIRVYVSGMNSQPPDNPDSWSTVSFLSPYFGSVAGDAGNTGYGSYVGNPSSYGMWFAPPDIGTTVICVFVNGDPNYGFYIGAVPNPDALQMVPAIGAVDNIVPNDGEAQSYGGATRLPVTNINSNNSGISDSADYLTAPKPVHSYSAAIMMQQGTLRDPIRGPISSSAQRETPSRVGWGVSTPGRPIYQGGFDDTTIASNLDNAQGQQLQVISRRGGHSIVMDDGDLIGRDQLVRIRSAGGHQITMSDDGQTLLILHANGQSYIELGKEGTVDIYSTNSFNVRTQGDLNLHADNNININAAKNLNIQANTMNLNSETTYNQRVGSDYAFSAGGKFTVLAGGALSLASGGDASLASGAIAYINGSKVNLNTGQTGTTPQAVSNIPLVAQTDTLHDATKGFIAAPAKLLTIVSRAPAHIPWANAGQGVDVEVDLSASTQLPAEPSPAVANTNQIAASSGTGTDSGSPDASNSSPSATDTNAGTGGAAGANGNPGQAGSSTDTSGAPVTNNAATSPVTAATIAAQPPVPAVSTSIDKPATAALLGTMQQTVASNPSTAAAATTGTAIAPDSTGTPVAVVGQYGLTPTQMESAGVLKPGSASLVNSAVASGSSVQAAMPPNLFTNSNGINSLNAFVNNPNAQANVAVATLQQSQTQLTNAGVITGAEHSTQISGLVLSGATVGVPQTISAVNSVNSVTPALASATGSVATTAPSGLGLASPSTALASVGGAATTTAAGTVSSFAGGVSSSQIPNVTGITNGLGSAAGSITATGSGSINSLAGGAVSSATKAISGASSSALSAISKGNFAAGLSGVSVSSLSSITSSVSALAKIPSLSNLSLSTQGASASAFKAIASSFVAMKAGVPQNLTTLAKAAAIKTAAASVSGGSVSAAAQGALGSVIGSAIGSTIGGLGTKSPLAAVGASSTTIKSSLPSSVVTNAVNGTKALTSSGAASLVSSVSNTNTLPTVGGFASTSSLSTTASGLQQAAQSAGAGALQNTVSATASGVSLLPGGTNTIASVVNKTGSSVSSVPGLSSVTSLAQNASSSALNNIVPSASSLGSSLAGGVASLSKGLPSVSSVINQAGGSLTALAGLGLSSGALSQLQGSISSLASGGASPVKLPTVGVNTTNRSEITAGITNVLGNPKIPAPNFLGTISPQATAAADAQKQAQKVAQDKQNYIDNYIKNTLQPAIDAYQNAKQTLPQGDPGIESAKQAWIAASSDPTFIQYQKDLGYTSTDGSLTLW